MKAIILLGTLKSDGLSNTKILSEFLAGRMAQKNIDCEIVRLVDYNILPGTYSNMGNGDDWPKILEKILASEIIIFATPIWWGGHSSAIQRVIERLDELHDEILEGKQSKLNRKVGGIVITGDSDGAQQVIGNIANFYNAIGITLPPYATLSVLWEGQAKGKNTTKDELIAKYEKDYTHTADTLVMQILGHIKD